MFQSTQAIGQGSLTQAGTPVDVSQSTTSSAPSTASKEDSMSQTTEANGQASQSQTGTPVASTQNVDSPECGTTASTGGAKAKRVSRNEKLLKFKTLRDQGKSREEIMAEMGITLGEFGILFFYLSQSEDDGIKIEYTEPVRKPKISTEAGFAVSMHNIERLHADDVFVAGKKVDLKYDREKKVIIASIYEGEDCDELSDEVDE